MWEIKSWQWVEFSSLWGWSVFWKRSTQKTALGFYPFINSPLFPLVLQLPFQLNGFLSEMQIFSWVTLLCNIIEWSLHSFTKGGKPTRLKRRLQLQFENTENDETDVWLKQLKPLLMSVIQLVDCSQHIKWIQSEVMFQSSLVIQSVHTQILGCTQTSTQNLCGSG